MRNRPRRGSRTTVTRTASLITFIKVRERQLRGGISARRKDRLDRVELTDDPRLTANRGRQRTNVGTKEVGAKKRDGNGQEEGFRPLESKFSMIGKCYRSFRHFFLSSIANNKIHRSSSSSSSSSSLFPYYMERKGETTLCAKK